MDAGNSNRPVGNPAFFRGEDRGADAFSNQALPENPGRFFLESN